MAALGAFGFLLAGASLALVIGSGAGRLRDPDDPTMLWVGLALFGGFCLVGLIVKVLSPERPPLANRPGLVWIVAVTVAGFVVGIALDIAN